MFYKEFAFKIVCKAAEQSFKYEGKLELELRSLNYMNLILIICAPVTIKTLVSK